MTKLQEIENKLLTINDAVFQNVCDGFLFFTEPGYPPINRTGSQRGKQKTVKGTPDSYYQLPNGKYVLIEYTTKDKSQDKNKFFEKIKDDIDKCLNPEITGIEIDMIEKVIYCCNTSLSISEDRELKKSAYEKGATLEIKTIDVLSFGLLGPAAYIAKEFLGVAIDTAQILPPEKFIDEYESSGFATKLRNRFFSREKDLDGLREVVEQNSVIILSGAPGLGKTRLVLALFDEIKKEDSTKTLFVISNKTAPIYDDLRTYLQANQDYVILIDDANRQVSNLASTLALLKERKKGSIRIVITVRDYALLDILRICDEYDPATLTLQKLSDDQLNDILQSDDFKIRNHRYLERILAIADGNPRLAVMAAALALQKQNLSALEDVSDLYDRYFKSTVDGCVFADPVLLKVLGVIAFFYSIDKTDTEFCSGIYQNFGIGREAFLEAITVLERLELLESSQDLSVIRIGEQVLGTYFFYKAFFKDRVLDFSVVLSQYFDTHLYRMTDTVVSANNTFGYENVYGKVDPYLTAFWQTIKNDEAKAFKFLDLFWFYKMDEALGFVYEKIEALPFVEVPIFEYEEKQGYKAEREKDRYQALLSNFYYHPLDRLEDALVLGAAYVRKKPETYTQFCKSLQAAFVFRQEDEQYDFYRQNQLGNYLTYEGANDELLANVFYEVMPVLMRPSHNITSGGRKRNSISWYQYNVSLYKPVKDFRKRIWKFVSDHFTTYKERSLEFMYAYLERTPDKSKEVFSFDLTYIVRLIRKHFKKNSFEHCFIVQDMIYWFSRIGIKHASFSKLREVYRNDIYETYLKLSYDRLRAKFEHDLQIDLQEFTQRKDREIREGYRFSGIVDFRKFYGKYQFLTMWGKKHRGNFSHSFDLIIQENTRVKPSLGVNLLQEIISSGNATTYRPWLCLQELSQSPQLYHQAFELIQAGNFIAMHDWLLNWLQFLPEDEMIVDHADVLVNIFRDIEPNTIVYLSNYEKFLKVDPMIFHKILTVIEKRNDHGARLTLDWHFFERNTERFVSDLPLLKRTYLQQQTVSNHFDHDFKNFVEILKLDSSFLIEYLDYWTKNHLISLREHIGLSIIWDLENAEQIVHAAFDYLNEKDFYHIKEDFCNVFFTDVNPDKRSACLQFLKRYLDANKTDINKVNCIFDCIRNSYRGQLEEFLLHLLTINPDYGLFEKLEWTNNFFIGNGHTIWGDVRATQYEEVLQILGKVKKQSFKLAKHKELIKGYILSSRKSADAERQRKFMHPDW